MNECPVCRICLEDGPRECPRDGAPLVPSLPGSSILDGKYRLDYRLGQGGMGIVYRARHLGLERDLAVKVIRFPDDLSVAGRSFAERFAIEARALGRLQHPGIVSVTDYGIDPRAGGVPYLAMELLAGETLRERLLASGPLAIAEALPLLAAIARAIDHAHAQGVLHRDLKPGNVLLGPDGPSGPEVKILDFGLARLTGPDGSPAGNLLAMEEKEAHSSEDTAPGALPATPRYLAPEVAAGGEATRAADVYSFAVMAWEVIGGPEALRRALAAALDARPERRPGSAGAVVEALRVAWTREEAKRWRARELPRRLAASLLAPPLAALLCLLLPRLGPVEELELRTVDARLAFLPPRVPDSRLLVISIDEASLAADATPLAVRAEELGLLLDRALAAGARGAAIDLLLPAAWSRSPAFSRLLLKYPDRVTLAAFSAPEGRVIGTDCVAGLTTAALGPDRAARLFGFVNVEADRDRVVRRARLAFPDRAGGWRETWAARAARSLAPQASGPPPGETFWIDPAIAWQRLDRLSWKDLEDRLAAEPGRFSGRLLLVGGDFAGSGDDLHAVPSAAGALRSLSGIALQALLVDTLLANQPVREAARGPVLAAVGAASFGLFAAALCLPRRRGAMAFFGSLVTLHLALAWTLAAQNRLLLPVVAPLLTLAAMLALGLAVRRLLTPFPSFRAALGTIMLCLLAPWPVSAEGSPVAVVTAMQGSAAVRSPGTGAARAAQLFDWLEDGTIVEMGPVSSLHVAFADGQRYRMGAGARARLTARGPQAVTGEVRFLERVPPLPRIAPLAGPEPEDARAAAIRLRNGEAIQGLYPHAGTAALAEATVLQFQPAVGADGYHVEVQDRGSTLFQAGVESEIALPADLLAPGARYRWRVCTEETLGPARCGEAWFTTLDRQAAERRRALREALAGRDDPESLALLAAVDSRLGLLMEAAQGFHDLGRTAGERGDLALAEDAYLRSLAIRESLAPGSLLVARSLNNLGIVARTRGDLAAAEELFRRSLALREALTPGSVDLANALTNLGTVVWDRGDLSAAEEIYRRALAILEKLSPGSLDTALALDNLGLLASDRGDLAVAEDLHRRALAIRERLAPESTELAVSFTNLGAVAIARGELTVAEDLFQRALEIDRKLAPQSLDVASDLSNLGEVAAQRGDLAAAERLHQQALAIRQANAPGSLHVAITFHNLGRVELQRGNLAAAEDFLRRSLAIQQDQAPDSLAVAASLDNLAEIAGARGDLQQAEALYQRALAIHEALNPGSAAAARSLYGLALILRRGGRLAAAAETLLRAVDTLERQTARLGGASGARLTFAARFADCYRDAVETLVETGRPAEALHVLERSRARAFLTLLAERDLLFPTDLPASLAAETRRHEKEYDRALSTLADLSPRRDAEQVEAIRQRLEELRREREEIILRVRNASPHYAALRYPEPLDLAGIRAALDPGTALLSYSVGPAGTLLFVVQAAGAAGAPPAGLSVYQLPIGETALRERIEAFRGLLAAPGERAPMDAAGRELYRLLLQPAEKQIAGSARLLIAPDGPLHLLPFAALVRGTSYLAAWKPVHFVLSATVYGELRRARRTGGSPPEAALTAFGDPAYRPLEQGSAPAEPRLRSAISRGLRLTPLPSSRQEVETIASLFPGSSLVFLGAQATEERAKTIGPGARYIHFACHAFVDERSPLDSALALAMPETLAGDRDNGLLQAWEILEQVRISADLVTLSACDSGLGKELRGEGLVGLTRAFQYAGARSVLASLWAVSDESTSALMTRFYAHLARGETKDEALRQAQLELLRDPATAHPFSWAAFQIFGDWR
jgi:CHAT domain-containing protein/serine/threonine protein kinase/Tfp pilus assembly protein PilF